MNNKNKIIIGGANIEHIKGCNAWGQAVTEGMIDPNITGEDDFLENSPYQVLGLRGGVQIWRANKEEPSGLGVCNVVRKDLCSSGNHERAYEVTKHLRKL